MKSESTKVVNQRLEAAENLFTQNVSLEKDRKFKLSWRYFNAAQEMCWKQKSRLEDFYSRQHALHMTS